MQTCKPEGSVYTGFMVWGSGFRVHGRESEARSKSLNLKPQNTDYIGSTYIYIHIHTHSCYHSYKYSKMISISS